jgi:hypothetical protein
MERSLRRRSALPCCQESRGDSVIQLAKDLDIPLVETIVPREMLYIADEVILLRHRCGDHAYSFHR